MEPNDLKSTSSDDAALEAWLRTSASLPPLPDGGFSPRVLSALPPPPPLISRRGWLCMAGGLVGSVVAVIGAATTPTPVPTIGPLEPERLQQLAIACGLAALALWFALRDRLWRPLRQ